MRRKRSSVSFATADWEPVRLLIARGLLTAEVSTWGETAEEDVRAALRSLGMSSCTAVPVVLSLPAASTARTETISSPSGSPPATW